MMTSTGAKTTVDSSRTGPALTGWMECHSILVGAAKNLARLQIDFRPTVDLLGQRLQLSCELMVYRLSIQLSFTNFRVSKGE